MLFSSMIFIYAFLPILCLLIFISKKEYHNFILLIASILFYAWGEPKYLAIMLLTIVINYLGAIGIEKFVNQKKIVFVLTLFANLFSLFYFKYFNFLIENLNDLYNLDIQVSKIVLPLGISFYTFQAISYLIDVYKGEVKAQNNFYKLALYICLFPQLVAGPIIKYHDIEEQINSREINFENVSLGVKRFIVGLSKKVLIANTMAVIVDKIFLQDPNTFGHGIAWLGAFAYAFQIYFDFSGYSDMAIGLGLIFGFKFMENFNYPYISKSITEFWRRWHISLSTWFKQYVYIPLGGNKQGLFKTCRNLGIVFLLTGIWHGAAWNFIIWGLWNGFFIVIEKIINLKEFEQKNNNLLIKVFQHIYCIAIFTIGWVIFRADNMVYACSYLMNMFGFLSINPKKINYLFDYYVDTTEIAVFIFAILCCLPIFKNIVNIKNNIAKLLINIWLLILFYLSTCSIATNTYNPFIYFRF